MSALGDDMRGMLRRLGEPQVETAALRGALSVLAEKADEHEAAALAESAQGRGPHAAAVLRWAADRIDAGEGIPDTSLIGANGLRRWARHIEAEQVQP